MYRTPRACYTVAPVRRETNVERGYRMFNQVPHHSTMSALIKVEHNQGGTTSYTINAGLVPGKAKFIKEPTRV